jgi:hypothetical protein
MSKKENTGLALSISSVLGDEDKKKKLKRDAAEDMYTALKMLLNSTSNREANIAVVAAKAAIEKADNGTQTIS